MSHRLNSSPSCEVYPRFLKNKLALTVYKGELKRGSTLFSKKPKRFFSQTSDNGDCRRELICPNNAKTHFPQPRLTLICFQPTANLSARQGFWVLFFRSGIQFSIYTQYNMNFKKNQAFFLINKFSTLNSANAASIISSL